MHEIELSEAAGRAAWRLQELRKGASHKYQQLNRPGWNPNGGKHVSKWTQDELKAYLAAAFLQTEAAKRVEALGGNQRARPSDIPRGMPGVPADPATIHPDDAFRFAKQAASVLKRTDNPHEKGSDRFKAWDKGWLAGKREARQKARAAGFS